MSTNLAHRAWPTMITPFHCDNEIDYNTFSALIEQYIENGADGLFATCQSSEIFYLSLEERVKPTKFIKEKTAGRVPVIAPGHVSYDLEDQARKPNRIAETSVDAVILISNRLAVEDKGDDIFIEHLERLLEQLPKDVKLDFYECPIPYKRMLTPPILECYISTGRFAFLKNACCDTERIREKLEILKGSGIHLFNTNTAALVESVKHGGSDYSGVMVSFQMKLYSWLVKRWQDDPETTGFLQNVLTACPYIELKNHPASTRCYLNVVGVPMKEVAREGRQSIQASMELPELSQLAQLTKRLEITLGISRIYNCRTKQGDSRTVTVKNIWEEKEMKRIIAALASVVMLSSVFSGCSGGSQQTSVSSGATSGDTSAPINTNCYGGWTGGDLDEISALVKKFNESQSEVQITFTSLRWSQMFMKFLADYQAGSAPDTVTMCSFELGQFVDAGVLSSNVIKSLNLSSSDYIKTAWDGTLLNGVQYGMPLDVNMHVLYYSKGLFKAAGITSAPTNKGELIAAAQKLTVDANGENATEGGFDTANIKQYSFSFLQDHHTFYRAFTLVNQQGYNPFADNMTTLSLDSGKTSAAFQFLEGLVYKRKATFIGEKSPIDNFKTGSAAMVINGSRQLSGVDSATKFDWDTATYPQIFSEKVVWGASELLAIPSNKDANKVKVIQTFIKWLSNNSTEWALSGQIPVNVKTQRAATKIKGVGTYNSELDYVKFLSAHKKSVKVFSNAAPSPILTATQNAMLSDKDLAEITKQLESDVSRVLAG